MPFTAATLKMYPITGGNPSNDTSPVGGALDTSSEWSAGSDFFFNDLDVPSSGSSVAYGLGGWAVDGAVAEVLSSAYAALRSAMLTNASAGQLTGVSTSSSDSGTLKIYGKVASVVTVVSLSLDGQTSVYTTETFDAGSILWVEYVSGGSNSIPVGNITLSVAGQVLGVIFGSASGHGVYQVNALTKLAVASAANAQITWSGTNNRTVAPDTQVGAFSYAGNWPGNDSSISLGYDLSGGDNFQFAIEVTLPTGLTLPPESGKIQVAVVVGGIEN